MGITKKIHCHQDYKAAMNFNNFEKDFFSQSWGRGFQVREMIMEENQKTWERFGEDFRNMSSISSSSMEQSHSRDSRSGQRFITPRENIWKMNRNPHDKESTLMKKDEAGHRMVSRMFSRKQTLPKDVKSEDIVSNLSSEGVLTVTAPRNNLAIK